MLLNCVHNLSSSDLFEKIVPLPVHEAMTAFDSRKSQIVNMEIGRLREQTTLMNGLVDCIDSVAIGILISRFYE